MLRTRAGECELGQIAAALAEARRSGPKPDRIEIAATVKLTGQTGVEMEALTAVSVAALTVYDMCKAVDRAMRITDIRVTHKAGGQSGEYEAD